MFSKLRIICKQTVPSPFNGGGYVVVVCGGATHMGTPLSSAELFDGVDWRRLPPMRQPREGCCATALPDSRRLVVAGGGRHGDGASVEVLDLHPDVPGSSLTPPTGAFPYNP